jgi:hypothetical protein
VTTKLLLTKLRNILGKGMKVEKLLDIEGFGCSRVIHERLLALKHPG